MRASRLLMLSGGGAPYTSFKALVDSAGNLCSFPYALDNAAWTKQRTTVTADAVTAPDGTTAADKGVEDNNSGSHNIFSANVAKATSAIRYRSGIFAKGGERTSIDFGLSNTNLSESAFITFDLSSGAVTGSPSVNNMTDASGRIFRIHDDWFWVEATATSGTSNTIRLVFRLRNASTFSYAGDGSSGMYAWGGYLGLA